MSVKISHVNCANGIHSFHCYLFNIATDFNRKAAYAGSALNAREGDV